MGRDYEPCQHVLRDHFAYLRLYLGLPTTIMVAGKNGLITTLACYVYCFLMLGKVYSLSRVSFWMIHELCSLFYHTAAA